MTQQTISVTRALVELKRYNDRIYQATTNGQFLAIKVGKENQAKVLNSNKSIVETENDIRGAFDKVDALIRNREELKAAIVISNASTLVQILGKSITVAEAIELKSSVSFREQYLSRLRSMLIVHNQTIERSNTELEAKIDVSLNNIYGSDKSKISADLVDNVAKPQRQQKELSLIDPAKIQQKIDSLTEEINAIKSELDFVLSESNAKTTVVVEL